MSAPQLPDQSLPWPIVWPGVELIARSESLALAAYRCPAGVWTCGWGETAGVTPATRWTREYADQRLCDSIGSFRADVLAACTIEPTPNQLAALVSFAYNCKGWRDSSVIKAHNRGDHAAAGRAFALWNKATVGGRLQVLPGLTTRRAAEAALYLTPEPDAPAAPIAQAVAAEPALVASPTVQTSTLAAGAGVLALLGDAKDQLGPVGPAIQGAKGAAAEVLAAVGVPAPQAADWALPALLIAVGLLVLYRRLQQRRQGLA